jgi:uncharacterized protein (DUF1697 family)
MNTYIALLRGINVGGKNLLPMKELASLMGSVGAHEVATYVQSGNAVFKSTERNAVQIGQRLSQEINGRCGFRPHILVLSATELGKAVAANPFADAASDPATLHLGFLDSVPRNPDLERLDSLRKGSERFYLGDSVFYLHAPEGVGRSRLAASAEKLLGVPMTDRNWKTVCKILEMARSA